MISKITIKNPGLKKGIIIGLIAVTMLSFLLAGITSWLGGGEMFCKSSNLTDESVIIHTNGTNFADLNFAIGSGNITIIPSKNLDPDILMDARVRAYDSVKDRIYVDVESLKTSVFVKSKDGELSGASPEEEIWEVEVNPLIKTEISISIGAGETYVCLDGMNISRITIGNGFGDIKVDASKMAGDDLYTTVVSGFGETELILPFDAEISAGVNTGLVNKEMKGFTASDDHWIYVPDMDYNKSVNVNVKQGIGSLILNLNQGLVS